MQDILNSIEWKLQKQSQEVKIELDRYAPCTLKYDILATTDARTIVSVKTIFISKVLCTIR